MNPTSESIETGVSENEGTPSVEGPASVMGPDESAGVNHEAHSAPETGRRIEWLDLLIVLAKRKRTVAVITLGFVLLTGVVSVFMPNKYRAVTVVLPPQETQSSLASFMMGQLGPLAALAPKNVSFVYVDILRSRTVADNLIRRFELQSVYKAKYMVDAREDLADATDVSADADGLVYIAVEDKDRKRATALANGYVEELTRVRQELAAGEAGQRRRFFEEQLRQAKEELSDAEVALKKTQETTGLIQLDSQAKAIIESAATLKAQVTAKEVQVKSMQMFATPQNPDLRRAEQELSALRSQLAGLTRIQGGERGEIALPMGKVPAAGLEYVRRFRDVKYYETIFELIAKQYEAAKLDESKTAAPVQVLDKAVEPEKKSKPLRALMLLTAGLVGLIGGIAGAFVQEALLTVRARPDQSAKLQLIRSYLTSKM